jgi:hypothetical protein
MRGPMVLVLVAACGEPAKPPARAAPKSPPPSSAAPTALAAPAPPPPERPRVAATSLSLGWYDACAVLADGGVACWGRSFGSTPRRIAAIDDAERVQVMQGDVAILRKSGTVAFAGERAPAFERTTHVAAVSREMWSRCVLLRDASVHCAAPAAPSARRVEGFRKATAVSVGRMVSCALADGGKVFCWTDAGRAARARRVPGIEGALELSVGAVVGCARLPDRAVRCWSLEHLDRQPIAAGSADTIEVSDFYDGSPFPILCRGDGRAGVCQGFDHDGSAMKPTEPFFSFEAETPIVQIARRSSVTCVLDARGDVSCAGSNADGQLAAPHPDRLETPRRIAGVPPMKSVHASNLFACALGRDGEIWCTKGGRWQAMPALGKADRLVAHEGYACAFARSGEATCAHASDEGLRNVARVPALDGARDVALPGIGHADLVAVATAKGELAIGPAPHFDSLADLVLTPIAGVADVRRVARTYSRFDAGAYVAEVRALDEQGRVHVQRIVDAQVQGTPRHLAELDGTVSMTADYFLRPLGELWSGDPASVQRLVAGSALTELVGQLPCGLDTGGNLRCVDTAPAVEGHPNDRVLLAGVTAAASYGGLFLGVDGTGALLCIGDDGRHLCGGRGEGMEKSDAFVVIPLR